MSAPAGYLAAALLFWGQQAGLLPLAAALAAALGAVSLLPRRWELSRADYSRISDLSALLFAGMAVYYWVNDGFNRGFASLLSRIPLALAPLLLAQISSTQGTVDARALFVSMRGQPAEPRWAVDLSYPFVLVCLVSAGAANQRTPVFFAGAGALVVWALWRARPKGGSTTAWAALVAASALLGLAGQAGLFGLQNILTNKAVELFFGGRVPFDAEESFSAIGHIGALKQSSRIVLRLELPAGAAAPRLLRGPVYNFYNAGVWRAWDAALVPAEAAGDGTWLLGRPAADLPPLKISVSLDRGAGVLPLPPAAARVSGLAGGLISRNRLGAVKIEEGPGLAVLTVESSRGLGRGAPPDRRDLELPAAQAQTMRTLARNLRLDPKHPAEAVKTLERFFGSGFRYSLYRASNAPPAQALEEFLLKTRAGHCEHFATAAVLLLRAAGIPARYAAGFSLQEYSTLERAWIARDRHAHAWALVFLDNAWRDADFTPASWGAAESARASYFERLQDWAGWVSYRFARWRWRQPEKKPSPVRWVLLAALAFFAVKWLRELWSSQRTSAAAGGKLRPALAPDSEWYAVERALAEAGYGRRPWETTAGFAARVALLPNSGIDAGKLGVLAALHTRRRFDPAGLDEEGLKNMRACASALLRGSNAGTLRSRAR